MAYCIVLLFVVLFKKSKPIFLQFICLSENNPVNFSQPIDNLSLISLIVNFCCLGLNYLILKKTYCPNFIENNRNNLFEPTYCRNKIVFLFCRIDLSNIFIKPSFNNFVSFTDKKLPIYCEENTFYSYFFVYFFIFKNIYNKNKINYYKMLIITVQ